MSHRYVGLFLTAFIGLAWSVRTEATPSQPSAVLGMTIAADVSGNLETCGRYCAVINRGCSTGRDTLRWVNSPVAVICPDMPTRYTRLASAACEMGQIVGSLQQIKGKHCLVTDASLPPQARLSNYENYRLKRHEVTRLVRNLSASFTDKQVIDWVYYKAMVGSGDDWTKASKTIRILRQGLRRAQGTVFAFRGRAGERLIELRFQTPGYGNAPHGGPGRFVVTAITHADGRVKRVLSGGPSSGSRVVGVYDFDGDGRDEVFINGWSADGMKNWNGRFKIYMSKSRKLIILYEVYTPA